MTAGSVVATVLTERVAAGGDAIGHLPDGRVLFVEGALPGERVAVEITELRRDFGRGRVATVVGPSAKRVVPPCPHVAAGCGGCPWQHVAVDHQIELKERIVVDALRRIAHLPAYLDAPPPFEVLSAARAPAYGYRTTVHLGVAAAGRPAYRRRHSNELIEVDHCLVAHPRLAELIDGVRLPGAASVTLRVGVAGGQRVAGVIPRRHAPPRSAARGTPGVVVPSDVAVVRPGQRAWVREDVGGRRWRVSVWSFFQSGPTGAEALVGAVDEAVGDAVAAGGLVVDAYAGVGLLGGVVAARRSARLVAIEVQPDAVADARHNLADVDAVVVATEVARWTPRPADVVVADPARSGLGRPGAAVVAGTGATRVVLVSCDPASLGRDTALLAGHGYRLSSIRVVDTFPGTVHVETVARFDLGQSPG